MKIKIKKETIEGFENTGQLLYYGIPLWILGLAVVGILLSSQELFKGLDTWNLFLVSGSIVLTQISVYNRRSIYFWFKDWKKRNVKNGVLEI